MVTIRPWWLAASLLAICTSCARQEVQPAQAAAKAPDRPTVAVASPQPDTLSRDVLLTGEFRPYQAVDLYSRVPGFLREVNVDVGSMVRAGQIVATVDVPELEADMAQGQAERRRAEAELRRARAELGRSHAALNVATVSLNRLLAASRSEPGIIAAQEIDEARARQAAAEAAVESARSTIAVEEGRIGVANAGAERSKAMAGYRGIPAPFAGVVVKRYADPGAMGQASPVVRLAEIGRLRLAVQVPESAVPLLRVGAAVDVRVPSSNEKFSASVARLTRDVLSASRTMEAEIDVANPGAKYAPGMYAEVSLRVDSPKDVLTVPVSAVINAGGNRSVYIVDDGRIAERSIRTGMESSGSLEVLDGLVPADRVIVSNRSLLRPGMPVDARPAGEI